MCCTLTVLHVHPISPSHHTPAYTHTHTHTHTHFTALQCDCNDQFWLSDCRHNGWTCTAREGTGVCSTRVRLLSNGTIIRETKCLDKRFNPLHCSGGYNTDTDVWECCNDRDYCNTDLSPSLNLRATSSTQAPSSVVPSSSHIPTTSPSHTTSAASSSSAVPPTIDMSPPTPLPTPPGENWSGYMTSHKQRLRSSVMYMYMYIHRGRHQCGCIQYTCMSLSSTAYSFLQQRSH